MPSLRLITNKSRLGGLLLDKKNWFRSLEKKTKIKYQHFANVDSFKTIQTVFLFLPIEIRIVLVKQEFEKSWGDEKSFYVSKIIRFVTLG